MMNTDILIVQINPNSLTALRTILPDTRYNFVCLEPQEAVRRLASPSNVGLICADEFDAVRQLMGQPAKPLSVPLMLFIEPGTTLPDWLKTQPVGLVDYVYKPIISEIVTRKVEALVEFQGQAAACRQAKFEEINQAKDEFLATVSHELRTPLTAVLGLTEGLQQEIYGALTTKQLRAINIIQERGQHLLSLIDDILDFSNIEAGEFELHAGPVFVQNVCNTSLKFIKPLASRKKIRVLNTMDDATLWIEADARCLQQILFNLLHNAVKFTPAGGQIGLEVAGDPNQQTIRFKVWDTGPGISIEDKERMFQPFKQLDGRLSRRYDGAGLGLSMVFRLVELHGGEITVESQAGRGSCFTVTLPCQIERRRPSSPGNIPVAPNPKSPRRDSILERSAVDANTRPHHNISL